MQALPILRINIPRLCACDQNSESCSFCPRGFCTGNRECQHCPEEVRTMMRLFGEFCSGGDAATQADVLVRKCEFAREAPAFFAAHASVREEVQLLLGLALGSFDVMDWHDVFRDALLFLNRLSSRPDWR